MVSKQVFLSVGLGVVIALSILLFSSQLYSNLAPSKTLDYGVSDQGSYSPLAENMYPVPENRALTPSPAVILIYVDYNPVNLSYGRLEFHVSSLILTFGGGGEVLVPNSLILGETFTLEPGERVLISAVPVYPNTLTGVRLVMSGFLVIDGIRKGFHENIFEWKGVAHLESMSPTIIQISITDSEL